MKCHKCGSTFMVQDKDGKLCIYCGYIEYKPIPEFIKQEIRRKGGYLANDFIQGESKRIN